MKLLLISPKWPEGSLWGQISFRFPYLSLTTLAALTPREWEVTLVDESAVALDLSRQPDLVGISLMTPLAKRGYEIADAFRAKGVPVVLGGIHATMLQAEAKEHADAVVVGEAEQLWPQVLADFQARRPQPFYQAQGYCDLAGLPFPRRELLPARAYFFTNTIQTTRGCPFDCDFCSVTSFFGRTYRTRPVADIVREIEHLKAKIIFFVDDNIAGRPAYAKELFQALTPLKVRWFSQASLTMTKDLELLSLAQQSGCKGLFIGFESLSQETLKALGKSHNQVQEYKEAVKKIHDHGIGIQGSFIFGTDWDDTSIFADVLRFIEQTHIEAALFSVLTPFPGTRIQQALARENRILHYNWEKYDMNHVVYQPKKMSVEQLEEGLKWAYNRLYGGRSIFKRLFPFKRSAVFFGVQNIGFRLAWKKALKSY
jgi:radical SAM superfamily enzyme YgiQ (UPF0313 family)